jgi:hypothetical protein
VTKIHASEQNFYAKYRIYKVSSYLSKPHILQFSKLDVYVIQPLTKACHISLSPTALSRCSVSSKKSFSSHQPVLKTPTPNRTYQRLLNLKLLLLKAPLRRSYGEPPQVRSPHQTSQVIYRYSSEKRDNRSLCVNVRATSTENIHQTWILQLVRTKEPSPQRA